VKLNVELTVGLLVGPELGSALGFSVGVMVGLRVEGLFVFSELPWMSRVGGAVGIADGRALGERLVVM